MCRSLQIVILQKKNVKSTYTWVFLLRIKYTWDSPREAIQKSKLHKKCLRTYFSGCPDTQSGTCQQGQPKIGRTNCLGALSTLLPLLIKEKHSLWHRSLSQEKDGHWEVNSRGLISKYRQAESLKGNERLPICTEGKFGCWVKRKEEHLATPWRAFLLQEDWICV